MFRYQVRLKEKPNIGADAHTPVGNVSVQTTNIIITYKHKGKRSN